MSEEVHETMFNSQVEEGTLFKQPTKLKRKSGVVTFEVMWLRCFDNALVDSFDAYIIVKIYNWCCLVFYHEKIIILNEMKLK